MNTLTVLGKTGDTKLTWDHGDPESVAAARETVSALAAQGFSFFQTNGAPADAVAAGGGTLLVRRLKPSDVVGKPERSEPESTPVDAAAGLPEPKRKGRPPKADKSVTAVRPMQGG